MGYMRSIDSSVLQEFGRIMEEKEGLKKIAQAASPLNEEEKKQLQHALNEFVKIPANGKGMEKWINRLKGLEDPYLKSVYDALSTRYSLWAAGKSAKEINEITLPMDVQVQASLKSGIKTADQKVYDVTGKEDIVHDAHPKPAIVETEVVENLNEQQEADKAIAEKSAKPVLTALYKLAKRLKSENNTAAYALVKATFLDISKSLKK